MDQAIEDFTQAIALNPRTCRNLLQSRGGPGQSGRQTAGRRGLQPGDCLESQRFQFLPTTGPLLLPAWDRRKGHRGLLQGHRAESEPTGSIFSARGGPRPEPAGMTPPSRITSQALSLNPNHSQAYNHRGAAYRKKGQLEKAIEDHTRAIELSANFGEGVLQPRPSVFRPGGERKSKDGFSEGLRPGDAEGCRAVNS